METKTEFKTERVSNKTVQASADIKKDLKVKGADWFAEPYSNIFLLAKKKSGKTTVIENILKHCSGKNTKFIFIVSTIHKDATWLRITKFWEEKGHDILTYDDLYNDGVNVIQEFMDQQKQEPIQGSGSLIQNKTTIQDIRRVGGKLRITTTTKQILQKGGNEEIKENKPKLVYPEYFIVLDDLGSAMRDKAINQLLKTNRHFKAKVILSAQNLNDLMPEAIRNLDYVLCFGRIPDEKMDKLRQDLLLDVDEQTFHSMYKDATEKPHSFFYIGRSGEDEFRKNFNDKYIL
jgi:hypothetical protein